MISDVCLHQIYNTNKTERTIVTWTYDDIISCEWSVRNQYIGAPKAICQPIYLASFIPFISINC